MESPSVTSKMVVVKANPKLGNAEIKGQAYDIPTSLVDGSLPLHFRLGVVGASGSGKTNAIVNYIKACGYTDRNIFTNIVLVSPSGTVNRVTKIRTEPKWDRIATIEYDHFSKPVLEEIQKHQLDRIVRYKSYLAHLELFKKFMKEGEEGLSDRELMVLDENDFKMPMPPFGQNHYPTLLLIFDDCCSSTQDKMLGDFFSKSRHINCSTITIVQHYAQMSLALRKQLSALMLFKTLDEQLLKLLWKQSVSGDMKLEKFLEMFHSLPERYNFIFMNFNAPPDKKYRKDFTDYFVGWGS